MHVLVLSCCFCEKVRDDAAREFGQGIWTDVETYRASHHLMAEELWLAPAYCPDCAANRLFNPARTVSEDRPAGIPAGH